LAKRTAPKKKGKEKCINYQNNFRSEPQCAQT